MVTAFADAPFTSVELEDLLREGGKFTWAAGPLAKGSNLCHGTGGNGYAFLKLYRRTNDLMWLERARSFAMTAIVQYREARDQLGRGRYSLWTGDIGLAVYLWDCLTGRATVSDNRCLLNRLQADDARAEISSPGRCNGTNAEVAARSDVSYGSMLLKKDYEGGLLATLIQDQEQMCNHNSRNHLPGFVRFNF